MPGLARRRHLAGFGLALSLLGIVGVTQYRAMDRMARDDSSVAHSEEVLGQLQGIAAAAGAAESDCRGYVATGNDVFLADFEPAVRSAQSHIAALRKLLADEPDQLSRLNFLSARLEQKTLLSRQAVGFRRDRGSAFAIYALNTRLGIAAMKDLRDAIETIGRPEEVRLNASRSRSRSTAANATRISVLGTLLAVVLFLFCAFLVRTDLRLRREAETRLAAERDFTDAVLDNITESIFACDTEGFVTRMNRAANRLFVHSNPIPIPLADFARNYSVFLPDGKTPVPVHDRPLPRALLGESVVDCELVVDSAATGPRHVLASAQPMRNRSGKIMGAVLALHDVTESRHAARLIREKDDLYSSVIATMAEGVAVHNSDGRVTACNDSALKILGVTSDRLLGSSSLENDALTIRADGTPFPAAEHPACLTLRTGRPQANVMMGIRKSGANLIWILINSQPLQKEGPGRQTLEAIVTFTDITDLRSAQEAIVRNERNLRDAQHLAGIGSWTRDAATGKILWSEQLYRIFGRDPALPPLWGGSATGVLSEESDVRFHDAVGLLLAGGTPFEMDLELAEQRGWVCARAEADLDGSRRAIGWRGTVQDITERKLVEKQLETYAAELDDLYNRAPCGYHSADPNGLIVRMNDTELNMLGYTAEEVIGKMRVPDFLPDDQKILFQRNFKRFKEQGDIHDLNYDFLRKDGSRMPILLSATMLRDADGTFLRSRATVVDVTDRKRALEAQHQAEAALRASEQRYRTFVERNPAGVVRTTETGEILDCNTSFARMLGFDNPVELIAHSSLEFRFQPSGRSRFVETLRALKVLINHETRLRTRGGAPIWVSATIFLNEDNPARPVHEAIVLDIGRRKEAEDSLALRNRLADIFLTSAPSEILSGVAAAIRESTESEQATLVYFGEPDGNRAIQSGIPAPGAHRLTIPIVFHDEPVGCFEIARTQPAPGDADRRFLSGIASYLAPLMRAHLLRDREERDREHAEEGLRLSLEEKEVLVREIHHRVKNNLQIMASLLRMQGNLSDNTQTRELFRESENRVASMSAIHESLYGATDQGRVDFAKYIRSVVDHIQTCYRRPGISCTVFCHNLATLPIKAAMPCGLIVNELVSNALKHAFAAEPGHVNVTIRREGAVVALSVEDDGKGLPPGFGLSTQTTLGISLVHSLIRQLGGRLTLGAGPGASFHLRFESTA